MLKIGLSNSDTFELRRRAAGQSTLVADPADYVANFFMEAMHKFSVIPIAFDAEVLNTPNIRVKTLKDEYKEALIGALTRPRLGNTERLFARALSDLEEGRDVYATPSGGILFLNWAMETGNISKFEVDTDLSLDEMGDINNYIVNKAFYPIAVERLLKLFMLFYSKFLTEAEISDISKFQNQLLYLDRQKTEEEMQYAFSCIKARSTELIFNVLEKVKKEVLAKNNQVLPGINIFNKIGEEIGSLQRKMNSGENRFFREDFVKISGNEENSEDFINKYIEAVS